MNEHNQQDPNRSMLRKKRWKIRLILLAVAAVIIFWQFSPRMVISGNEEFRFHGVHYMGADVSDQFELEDLVTLLRNTRSRRVVVNHDDQLAYDIHWEISLHPANGSPVRIILSEPGQPVILRNLRYWFTSVNGTWYQIVDQHELVSALHDLKNSN